MSATQFVCKKKHAGKKKPTNALFFSEAVLNDIFLAKVLWCAQVCSLSTSCLMFAWSSEEELKIHLANVQLVHKSRGQPRGVTNKNIIARMRIYKKKA